MFNMQAQFSVLAVVFIQVQCHVYTGYCWCVTPNGRPISGTAVAHKTPRCPGKTYIVNEGSNPDNTLEICYRLAIYVFFHMDFKNPIYVP